MHEEDDIANIQRRHTRKDQRNDYEKNNEMKTYFLNQKNISNLNGPRLSILNIK